MIKKEEFKKPNALSFLSIINQRKSISKNTHKFFLIRKRAKVFIVNYKTA
jgi:hypothetical protein